jgi:hypothetical protein
MIPMVIAVTVFPITMIVETSAIFVDYAPR